MKPDSSSASWEGLQGVDSFFPWQIGGKWFAFYGSCPIEHVPIIQLRVGLATASSINGPWKRMYDKRTVKNEFY